MADLLMRTARDNHQVSVLETDTKLAFTLREGMKAKDVKSAVLLFSRRAFINGTHSNGELQHKLSEIDTVIIEAESRPYNAGTQDLIAKIRQIQASLKQIVDERVVIISGDVSEKIATDAGSAFDDACFTDNMDPSPRHSLDILDSDEMLTSTEFGKRMGISRQTVMLKRKKNEVLALQGNTKVFKFPIWQLGENNLTLKGLSQVLSAVDFEHWTAYRYLSSTFPDGTGRKGYEVLRDDGPDLVVEWISGGERGGFD